MIHLIDYEDRYHEDFRKLNLEWLEKYHLTETHDLQILDDPRSRILNKGGAIYLAVADEEIVGTAGLMKEKEGNYELVKMAVDTKWQGRGIGKMLIEKCLDTARKLNATKVTLYSNSKLQTAIRLYENYGFRHVELFDSPLETADVRMELTL